MRDLGKTWRIQPHLFIVYCLFLAIMWSKLHEGRAFSVPSLPKPMVLSGCLFPARRLVNIYWKNEYRHRKCCRSNIPKEIKQCLQMSPKSLLFRKEGKINKGKDGGKQLWREEQTAVHMERVVNLWEGPLQVVLRAVFLICDDGGQRPVLWILQRFFS